MWQALRLSWDSCGRDEKFPTDAQFPHCPGISLHLTQGPDIHPLPGSLTWLLADARAVLALGQRHGFRAMWASAWALTAWQLASIRGSRQEDEKGPEVCQQSRVLPRSPLSLSSRLERMLGWLSEHSVMGPVRFLISCLGVVELGLASLLSSLPLVSTSKTTASHSHDCRLRWSKGCIGRNASIRYHNNDSTELTVKLLSYTTGWTSNGECYYIG